MVNLNNNQQRISHLHNNRILHLLQVVADVDPFHVRRPTVAHDPVLCPRHEAAGEVEVEEIVLGLRRCNDAAVPPLTMSTAAVVIPPQEVAHHHLDAEVRPLVLTLPYAHKNSNRVILNGTTV